MVGYNQLKPIRNYGMISSPGYDDGMTRGHEALKGRWSQRLASFKIP